MFVENIPHNLDRYGLKGIFQRAGRVSDSYIPSKLGRSRKRFGFVRFWSEAEAVNSIRWFNGISVRGFRIRVSRARFGKGGLGFNEDEVPKLKLKMKARKLWCENNSQNGKLKTNHRGHEDEVLATVVGETNELFMEWLSKSLICVSNESWGLDDLSQALVGNGCSKIRALSKYKFVLTYNTSEQKDVALKNQDNLGKWFQEVKNWDIYEVCGTKRLWIEVFGVPPHGWSLRNFESITSIWGKLICLETPIEDTISFESMKILIESNNFQQVMGHILLQIGDAGYRIMVKEASCSFNINPQFIVPAKSSSIMVKNVNEGNSEPVLHDDGASKEDEERNRGSNASRMDSANSAGVARGAPLFEFDGEVGQGAVNGGTSSMIKAASSKTKTAQLSGNGYSEEMKKMYYHTPAQSEEVEGFISPGFTKNQHAIGNSENLRGLSLNNQSSVMIAPPGFNDQFEEGSGETLIPPGFEGLNDSKVCITRKGKRSKGHLVNSEKRVTRSQVKARREFGDTLQNTLNRRLPGRGGEEVSPRGIGATNNTDSTVKLVKESFEMGELLGIRVIGNKDDAIKNFTQILRSERYSGHRHHKAT